MTGTVARCAGVFVRSGFAFVFCFCLCACFCFAAGGGVDRGRVERCAVPAVVLEPAAAARGGVKVLLVFGDCDTAGCVVVAGACEGVVFGVGEGVAWLGATLLAAGASGLGAPAEGVLAEGALFEDALFDDALVGVAVVGVAVVGVLRTTGAASLRVPFGGGSGDGNDAGQAGATSTSAATTAQPSTPHRRSVPRRDDVPLDICPSFR